MYFCHIENFAYGEIDERSISNPHPKGLGSLLCQIFMWFHGHIFKQNFDRKWQDYVYIQCEYKSTKQKIKHLLREENKVKENKIS